MTMLFCIAESKKSGTTLGGRGYGKLKQTTIIKLTGCYGKAIRSCPGDLDAMRNAVFATFFHSASTDDDPHHSRCPVGSNSWCFFQRALAAGEEPGSHRDKLGTPLTRDVSRHVEEVYVRLGYPDLLRRCLKGATQNANESPHSKVWAKCPKTGLVGFQRVVAATCAAIAEFNQGVESTVARTYDTMAMDSGINLRCLLQKRMTTACSSLVGKCRTAQGRHALLVLLHVRMLRKQLMHLELSECCSMYTKCIQCLYHTHTQ